MIGQALVKDDFLKVIEHMPLVSIDLVVVGEYGVLMGERLNRPAQGFWFVPGGRIFKGETLAEAFRRISRSELGVVCEIDAAGLLGAFTHLYDDNFAGMPGITTHYVALAYQLRLGADFDLGDLPVAQHGQYRWISADSDLKVHANSLVYFDHLQP